MLISALVPQFLEHLEQNNASLKTLQNYHHYLTRFLEFMGRRSPSDITPDSLRRYNLYLEKITDPLTTKKLKKATQAYHLVALRSFLSYLQSQDLLPSASIEDVAMKPYEKPETVVLDPEQVVKVIKAVQDSDQSGLRDRAIIELLYATGMLVSELVGLNKDSINGYSTQIELSGTGLSLKRMVTLPTDAHQTIIRYLQTRTDNFKPLFLRHLGEVKDSDGEDARLSARSVQRIVQRHGRKVGLEVTPLVLRHSFIRKQELEGVDINEVQQKLGHLRTETTKGYFLAKS